MNQHKRKASIMLWFCGVKVRVRVRVRLAFAFRVRVRVRFAYSTKGSKAGSSESKVEVLTQG